jgi:hypothetical protein
MRRFVAVALSATFMLQAAPLIAAPVKGEARAGHVQAPVTGGITGTVHSSACQTLSNYTVQVRNLRTGQLAGTTTSNAAGSFSFVGLTPLNYTVELVNKAGAIVSASSPIAVAAGTIATVTLSASAAAEIACVEGGAAPARISTAVIVTTAAVAAGIAAVVLVVRRNASPSR